MKSSNNNDDNETLTIDAALQNAKANAIKNKNMGMSEMSSD